jgi:plasmid replication initiation protein
LVKKTLDLTPHAGEMLKPKELIEVRSTGKFTLEDRRVYNALIEKAWGPKLGDANHVFEVPTGELRAIVGDNQRLKDTLRTLMTTLIEVEDGDNWKATQLLGTSELVTNNNTGIVRFTFPLMVVGLIKNSTIFAKLDLEVMRSFRSKYAFSLYEAIARRVNMRRFTENLTTEDVRNILGVEDGKLEAYKNLNMYAIQPALLEVNSQSPYTVSILPVKKGRKVVSFIMGWETKTVEQLQAAHTEMQRHSAGRKARADGTTEQINTQEDVLENVSEQP